VTTDQLSRAAGSAASPAGPAVVGTAIAGLTLIPAVAIALLQHRRRTLA
jgi:hypothetical protein